MTRSFHPRAVLLALILSAFGAPPGTALADAPAKTVSDADRKAAELAFAEGQKAFQKGDFRHAAEVFEQAYKLAPHPSPLWNAARAWHRADESARAANLYAKYLEEAPTDARDRDGASRSLKELKAQLVRLEIHAPDFEEVRVDGQKIESAVLYVAPGAHLIEGHHESRAVKQTQTAAAGSVVSVVLTLPAEAPVPTAEVVAPPQTASVTASAASTAVPAPSVTASAPPEKRAPLPPAAVIIGSAICVLGAGLTIGAGLDTLGQKDKFLSEPTQENLDVGRDKQLRTNVALGVTLGLSAVTVAMAVFLVDWKGEPKKPSRTSFLPFGQTPSSGSSGHVTIGAGPGFLSIRGAY